MSWLRLSPSMGTRLRSWLETETWTSKSCSKRGSVLGVTESERWCPALSQNLRCISLSCSVIVIPILFSSPDSFERETAKSTLVTAGKSSFYVGDSKMKRNEVRLDYTLFPLCTMASAYPILSARKQTRWGCESDKVDLQASTTSAANPNLAGKSSELLAYAMKVFGTTDLEEHQWKQCNDQLKVTFSSKYYIRVLLTVIHDDTQSSLH